MPNYCTRVFHTPETILHIIWSRGYKIYPWVYSGLGHFILFIHKGYSLVRNYSGLVHGLKYDYGAKFGDPIRSGFFLQVASSYKTRIVHCVHVQ